MERVHADPGRDPELDDRDRRAKGEDPREGADVAEHPDEVPLAQRTVHGQAHEPGIDEHEHDPEGLDPQAEEQGTPVRAQVAHDAAPGRPPERHPRELLLEGDLVQAHGARSSAWWAKISW